ncbi:MAG: hypothetical protein IKH16_07515, partial [Selenomonadaceae bacterium]|nr:hypothetical protein [Selenomonadaceae bacterium]
KSKKNRPYVIRIRIRMADWVDSTVFRDAVDTTMKRYPYFCVKLREEGGAFVFEENPSPVVISDLTHGVELNSKSSNHHMISFSCFDDWIVMDIFHGLTDATGAYEVIRTLLFYYCSSRYNVALSERGIRTTKDDISIEEWECPVMNAVDLPTPRRYEMPPPLNPSMAANLPTETFPTVFSVIISEKEFMRFNRNNDGSPGTVVALILSRSIAELFPNAHDVIRIILCVNQRKALHAPLAHQSLVGGALLEYGENLRHLPLKQQIQAYRKMVFSQTDEENVLAGISSIVGLTNTLLSKGTTEERIALASFADEMARRTGTACVSYVGKANFMEAEKYVQEFHLWTYSALPITIEISAVNGKFTFDFIQHFRSPIYIDAFLKELDKHGISYNFQDGIMEELPNIKLQWNQE